jgi:hypothetical protein
MRDESLWPLAYTGIGRSPQPVLWKLFDGYEPQDLVKHDRHPVRLSSESSTTSAVFPQCTRFLQSCQQRGRRLALITVLSLGPAQPEMGIGTGKATMQGRHIALIVCAFLLAGCATAAQRQYQSIVTENKALGEEAKTCTAAIYNSPEAAPLRAHAPLDPREATLAQLSDTTFGTGAEIAAIELLHPRLKACQKEVLDGLASTTPGAVPILAKAFSAADDDTILFIQRKLSWGDRVKRGRDRALATQEALQAEGQRVVSGLEQQHEAEMAQRQRAADALAQWAQTQAILDAGPSRLPAGAYQLPGPTFTNCTYGGGYANCVTH